MSKQSIFTELRNARVERLLASKPNRILTAAWMRRLLSLVAIISSYVLLATLLIPTPYIISKTNQIYPDSTLISENWIYLVRDNTQGIALLLLIWSFVLLRFSMRRVTLLPDEYLDELQITNRDWAFKTGYLVVRRIGFAVAIVFGLLASIGTQLGALVVGAKTMRSAERYLSDLSMEDPFGFYFKVFLLLAFVAYSFPIILLAWREARFPESVPEIQSSKELGEKQNNAKFYFGALRVIVIFFSAFASLWFVPKLIFLIGFLYYGLLLPLIYLVIPGALFMFVWASVTVARGIIELRKTGFKSDLQKRWANLSTGFLTLTLFLGVVVGSAMLGSLTGFGDNPRYPGLLLVALFAGLLMIPTQAVSMTFYAKLDND